MDMAVITPLKYMKPLHCHALSTETPTSTVSVVQHSLDAVVDILISATIVAYSFDFNGMFVLVVI